MKKVNFNHSGGFPLEQETLERLQKADKSELYEALKAHLSLDIAFNYILASPKNSTKGLAIIHQNEKDSQDKVENRGILYPINPGTDTGYLKTTRSGTNLVYGDGTSQTAYFDYEAQYISQTEYDTADKSGTNNTESSTVYYYELKNFRKVMDLETLEAILAGLDNSVKANTKAIGDHTKLISDNTKNIGDHTKLIGDNTNAIEKIKEDYLPRDGSKSMTGNLTVQGKVSFNNVDLTDSRTLLLLNGSNQVVKNNTLIQSILNEIEALKNRSATAIPKGMIAIWGRPANQIPEGWQEYIPLRGRMPVGFDLNQSEFNEIEKQRGAKNKTLLIEEMPPHSHGLPIDGGGTTDMPTLSGSRNNDEKISDVYKTGPSGEGQAFSLLNPYSVVHFIEYTGLPNNTTKPTPPTNLTVTKATSSSISLSWTKVTDNAAVTNYLLSVDGGDLISLGNTDTYTVTDLTSEKSYTFKVFAQDSAGNISDGSTITKVTPPIIPVPQSLRCRIQQNEVIIEWDHVTSYTPITYLLVRKITEIPGSDATFARTSSNLRTDFFGNYTQMHTHHYKVQALGEDGNESEFSAVVTKNVYPYDPQCFDIESLVTMTSGQSKKLKNIAIGDKLQGFSFPNEIDESEGDYFLWNGKLNEAVKAEVTVVDKRTSIQPNFYEIKTADNIVKVTGEHPLLVTEDAENLKWVRAKKVQQTMLLIDKLGKTIPIESIVFKEEPLEVALLDVENVDNYVISGIIAHNTKVDPLE